MIIGGSVAVGIKATENPGDKHLKGIRALMEEGICKHYYLVSNCREKRITNDGIRIFHWKNFLKLLWAEQIVE